MWRTPSGPQGDVIAASAGLPGAVGGQQEDYADYMNVEHSQPDSPADTHDETAVHEAAVAVSPPPVAMRTDGVKIEIDMGDQK
jgi:hypothetical protein